MEADLPPGGSLSACLPMARAMPVEVRIHISRGGDRDPSTGPSSAAFPNVLAGKWIASKVAGSQISVPIWMLGW